MVMAVSQDNQNKLSAQGFDIDSGNWFTDQSIVLYAHKELPHRKVGEVALTLTVVNPRQLNEYEAEHLARKALFGFFPWKPGEDCLGRTFQDKRRVSRPGGGFVVEKVGEAYKGCKWCRQSTFGSQGAVAEQGEVEPFPPVPVTPPAVAPEQGARGAGPLACGQCGFTTIKGEWVLKSHVTRAHSSTRNPRTRKGAGRRKK